MPAPIVSIGKLFTGIQKANTYLTFGSVLFGGRVAHDDTDARQNASLAKSVGVALPKSRISDWFSLRPSAYLGGLCVEIVKPLRRWPGVRTGRER